VVPFILSAKGGRDPVRGGEIDAQAPFVIEMDIKKEIKAEHIGEIRVSRESKTKRGDRPDAH
jgi:hypothetical protein